MKLLIVCLLPCLFALAAATGFEDCGSTATGVMITEGDCPDDDVGMSMDAPCKIKGKKDQKFTVKFTPKEDAQQVKASIVGKDDSTGYKYTQFYEADVCGKTEPACPLTAGTEATTDLVGKVYDIKSTLPFRVLFTDENGNMLVCADVYNEVAAG